ncbi:hypothetical protein F4808DRAFT_436344 [Astrocystis sublimbata]|nr:hypothetical protein F4808DRAFT_436344 [Astrocystis sublimbata]
MQSIPNSLVIAQCPLRLYPLEATNSPRSNHSRPHHGIAPCESRTISTPYHHTTSRGRTTDVCCTQGALGASKDILEHEYPSKSSVTESSAYSGGEKYLSTTTLSRPSEPDHNVVPCDSNANHITPYTNNGAEPQPLESYVNEVHPVFDDASTHESMQQDAEAAYQGTYFIEDDPKVAELLLSRSAITEYDANLEAASDDSRHLFAEFYKRTYGEATAENEGPSEEYWKWDDKIQQWFHMDAKTQLVEWFMG